ncbi:hypothetical protein [Flavobacterium capsici]|uniref:DUF3185 family protein n=1 Tax=Flavobacterium capsici TaxID=3075618 RepID=A0AA96F3L9_9FLAO|nr:MULTISPECIES: hypothetical protein [unclassified Flavobacterium]WNM18352.1 hypothetical protein RN608_10030 [Flavobacterium sp. PMR2A8]WNM22403.1 hypothetical protein RN605_03330 [Flavobacterium sp. PMTSA4]
MKAPAIVGSILTLVALVLGVLGITTISSSTTEVNVLGLELKASDLSEKQKGYMYLGSAVLLLAGGLYSLKSKS